MTVPDDVGQFYGERVNVLMAEIAALAENLKAARAARTEADTALKAAPAEYQAALTKAAREGAKKLPTDPVPGLEATLAEADRLVNGLVAAGRQASGELADALDDLPEPDPGCGCASAPGGVAFAPLLVLGLVLRRRRRSA